MRHTSALTAAAVLFIASCALAATIRIDGDGYAADIDNDHVDDSGIYYDSATNQWTISSPQFSGSTGPILTLVNELSDNFLQLTHVADNARVLCGDVDPSAGAGVAAPSGSIFLRTDDGTVWIKGSDSPDTDWSFVTVGLTAQNLFETIDAPAGTDPVADTPTDTLALTETGTGLTITGNATTDTVDFQIESGYSVVADGAVTGSALRWSGSEWVAEPDIRIGTDAVALIDGTDHTVAVNETGVSEGGGYLNSEARSGFRWYGTSGGVSLIHSMTSAGAATFYGNILANADNARSIGAPGTEFATAWIQTIDDNDGLVTIDAPLEVVGSIHQSTIGTNVFAGNLTQIDGDVELGDSNARTVEFNARVGSSVYPSADNTWYFGFTSFDWAAIFTGLILDSDNTLQIQDGTSDITNLYGDLHITDLLGVGTTNPLSRVHVIDAAGPGSVPTIDDLLTTEDSGSNYVNIISGAGLSGGVLFSDGTRAVGWLLYNHSTNKMSLQTNGSVRMTIDSSGQVGVNESSPDARFEISTGSAEGKQTLTIDQNDADQAFVDFQGTYDNTTPVDSGNLSTADANATNAGGISAPTYGTGGTSGWIIRGMAMQEINGTEYWVPFYERYEPAECPRIDAWIDGEWATVGRAIRNQTGFSNQGQHDISLSSPAQRFRLVEDEAEISVVRWIRGDGEEWGLGTVITDPAPAGSLGQTAGMFSVEWEFSQPVSTLETYGYYMREGQ